MKHIAWIFVAALFMAACNLGDSIEFSGDLGVGEVVEGILEVETPDTFRFEFGANTYIYGICNQLSVDVIVSLYDSTGTTFGVFEGPGEGPEQFYFELKEAGEYFLEVKPFEKKSGDYTLELQVVEPIATDPEKRADQIFRPFSGDETPGGVIGVIREGKVVFSKAYGMANLTHGLPYTIQTPTNIGSVSKQFTATAILLLEQQGKLSLDDDVRKHIPELPDLGQVVTLKNLLNHTTGYREVYNLIPMTGWKGEDVLRREEVLEILKRQEELQNAPGEEYNYNNSAFIMLAEIVERISGQTFPEFMEESVFGPLGMSSSVVRANPSVIIPDASQGYAADSAGYHEAGDLYAAYGAGGIYTTVEDLSKWMGNFYNPVLGDAGLINRLVTPDTLNNGDTMTYAQGIIVGEYKGLVRYSHSGADIAHRAQLIYFPEIDAGVVAMSNNAGFPSGGVAYAMADVFLGDEMEEEESQEEVKDSASVEVPQGMLELYAGDYMIKGVGFVLSFSFKDEMLKLTTEGQPEAEMQAKSQTRFKYEGVDAFIEFHLDDQGKVTGAVHSQGGQDYELELVAPYDPSMELLQAYTGKYLSDELEAFYTLELRDSTLVILIRNTPEIKLEAVKPDHFKGDVFFLSELLFERNEAGDISGFTASNDRTRGIWFEKY